MKKKFSGVVVPMVTPVRADFTIDVASAERLVNHVVSHGASPFILGTTGESASIGRGEKKTLVETAVKAAAGQSVVYAGISGNSIMDSIEDARHYHDLGADVFVATMPSYYPAGSEQMLPYFTMLADQIPAPLIIYNIPGTTHLSIPVEVVDELSRHPNIAGFKDSERSVERLETCISLWKNRTDFSFLTGWAAQSQHAMKLGADGIIPSTGNIAPGVYDAICKAAAENNMAAGESAQQKADGISEIYQKGRLLSQALPVLKAMMAAYGLCQTYMVPPLYPVTPAEEQAIRNLTITQFGDLTQINSIELA